MRWCLGIASSRMSCLYSSQATAAAGTGGAAAQAVQAYTLPGSTASGISGYLVQANYTGAGNSNTATAAFQPAGYPGAGNWPIWMINDWQKWYIAYGSFYQNTLYADLTSVLRAGLQQGIYEGGITSPIPPAVIDSRFKSNDCMSHPSFADTYYGFWIGSQLGNPAIPGTGVKFGSVYTIWYAFGGDPGENLFCMSEGPNMPAGLGTNITRRKVELVRLDCSRKATLPRIRRRHS
jgi:hypothetical protein